MGSTRRQFLKKTVTGVVGVSALGALNAPFIWTQDKTKAFSTRPTLVVIYLRGGADPLNTVVPYRDRDYYAVRPTIAIAPPGAKGLEEGERPCIALDRMFGLHPAMEPLMELWERGMLAPIVNVGSTHETRSHFDAQDFMEWAAPGIKSIQEGWLNRYLQMTAGPEDHFLRGFSPQALLPRSLRGQYSVLAAPGPGSDSALDAFADLYKPCDEKKQQDRKEREELAKLTPAERRKRQRELRKKLEKEGKPPVTEEHLTPRLHDAGINTVTKLQHLNKILNNARDAREKYPEGPLGGQLADIAAVIKSGDPIEIAALDYNGWDHHSYQGGSMGQQARMLRYLSQCIATFVRDIGAQRMQRTMILTMTEFGRTVAENGSQGSDHGHGGFMLAISGRLNGGKVYGKWTGLTPGSLHRKRDLPVHVDFRDVFAETLVGMFGFDTREREFFPGFKKPLNKPLKLFETV